MARFIRLSARVVATMLLLGAQAPGPSTAPTTRPTSEAFEALKNMTGEWRAKVGGEVVNLRSQVVASGSAIIEFLDVGGEMVTVYHMDGDKLMLTHYCHAGNQPRMIAGPLDSEGKITFEFKDGTNFEDANAAHMHRLTLTFVDSERVVQEWFYYKNGQEAGSVRLELERLR